MATALASAYRVKGNCRRLRRRTSGRTVYAYVGGNPVPWIHWGLQSRDFEYEYRKSGAKPPPPGTPGPYDIARQWRTWGHQTFPGERNSAMRHCAVSCILSKKISTGAARASGVVNEAQGLVLHDIPNLRSRLKGNSAWACQTDDVANNERGFAAGDSLPSNLSDTQLTQSCITKCGQ